MKKDSGEDSTCGRGGAETEMVVYECIVEDGTRKCNTFQNSFLENLQT